MDLSKFGFQNNGGGGIVPEGIAYQRPMLTGQTTSYRTGDDGWHYANGTYNYTPPANPLYIAELSDFVTLKSNNVFGNTSRFTDELGGQTYTNNYVIDNYTGLGWYRIAQGGSTLWNDQIDNAHSSSLLGHNDWRVCNINEIYSIVNLSISANSLLDYSPFNEDGTTFQVFQSSTTNAFGTSNYVRFVHVANWSVATDPKTLINKTRFAYLCRNHFN